MKKLILSLLIISNTLAFGQALKVQHARIGARSVGNPEVRLKLVARLQALYAEPGNKADVYDKAIYSPKSAHVLEKTVDGKNVKKLYVNSLEGGQTVVYDMNDSLKK